MSYVDPASDWYSALVPVIIYVISYNLAPRYNGISIPQDYGGDASNMLPINCAWHYNMI